MYQNLIKDLKVKLDEVIEKLSEEFKNIHTGRASAGLVENITATYYGQMTPLKQMANITIPDANMIIITPYDINSLGDIELAVRNSELKFNPVNDGKSVRISLPPLTEERRVEFVKLAEKMAEECKVVARNLRQDVWNNVKKQEKDGELTEDDRYTAEEELNKLIKEYNDKIEKMTDEKVATLKQI
jgi:ribosome recycling factor